ncbi:hypothetical protein QQF64_025365 [Cirrhinus molitorella]|uniref:Uncharacterized protein n=1 Tax=Cirrhinus molitorella TaxID=172907 RepID=A0ABR3NP76_9TELE
MQLDCQYQKWLTEGEQVTLICEVNNSSTGWTFSCPLAPESAHFPFLSQEPAVVLEFNPMLEFGHKSAPATEFSKESSPVPEISIKPVKISKSTWECILIPESALEPFIAFEVSLHLVLIPESVHNFHPDQKPAPDHSLVMALAPGYSLVMTPASDHSLAKAPALDHCQVMAPFSEHIMKMVPALNPISTVSAPAPELSPESNGLSIMALGFECVWATHTSAPGPDHSLVMAPALKESYDGFSFTPYLGLFWCKVTSSVTSPVHLELHFLASLLVTICTQSAINTLQR